MIPRILLVKCYIDHRPLAVKLFATSGVTQAFLVLCQGLTILGSDAKKSQQSTFQSRRWGYKKLHALPLSTFLDSRLLVIDKRLQLKLQLEILHDGLCLQVACQKFVHLLPWSECSEVGHALWHSSCFSLAMNPLCKIVLLFISSVNSS